MTIFQLKILAAILMTIDHIGMYFPGTPSILRWIGRLSFPLFLFCMTQGYRHTRSRKKYLLRLYCMSLVMTAIIYLCGSDYGYHNIFLTLFWVGVFISTVELFQKSIPAGCAAIGALAASQVLFGILRGFFPDGLRSLSGDVLFGILPNPSFYEYGVPYAVLGVAMYFFAENRSILCASCLLLALFEFCSIESNGFNDQCLFALALPFILRYNGEKGPGLKWFFYLFYPAHTLLLFWLSTRFPI